MPGKWNLDEQLDRISIREVLPGAKMAFDRNLYITTRIPKMSIWEYFENGKDRVRFANSLLHLLLWKLTSRTSSAKTRVYGSVDIILVQGIDFHIKQCADTLFKIETKQILQCHRAKENLSISWHVKTLFLSLSAYPKYIIIDWTWLKLRFWKVTDIVPSHRLEEQFACNALL